MNTDVLSRTVEVTAGLTLDRVPSATLARAGLIIADAVGIICAGSHEPEMIKLVQLMDDQQMIGAGASTVMGPRKMAANPAIAAYLNATAGTFPALDEVACDESMRPGSGHPAMHIVPAAIAIAQARHATGNDLLRAIIVGYETSVRLHQALRVRYPVHENGHISGVGAAVTVAIITGRDPLAAARIAATAPLITLWNACFEGATARNTWFGHSAQLAILASTLDEAGFTGSPTALETAFGSIAGDLTNPDHTHRPLDYGNLAIGRNLFKRHAACYGTHAALQAAGNLPLERIAPNTITRIRVELPERTHPELVNQPTLPNSLAGQFSVPYAVATRIARGDTSYEAFRYNAEIAELAKTIEVAQTASLDQGHARIKIEWDGESAVGVSTPTEPLTSEEIELRFSRFVNAPRIATQWWQQLTDLSSVANCADLLADHG